MSRKTVAEVPLTGLSFLILKNGPDQGRGDLKLGDSTNSEPMAKTAVDTLQSETLNRLQGANLPAMDQIQAKIAQIQTATDFGDWLKSFMDRVRDNPEIFSQTMESMNWLRDISRFAAGNHQGYFASLNSPVPDSPQSWQLLAHVIYSTFPDGD
jgi:hypothetical protein